MKDLQQFKNPLDLHVFVCTNQKSGKPCCADRGGEELRQNLKTWARANPSIASRVRINAAGCLDHCTEGVAVALFKNNPPGQQSTILFEANSQNIEQVKQVILDQLK